MPDNKEIFGLDLDLKDFKEGISVAKEGLSSLTAGTNVEGLSSLFMKMSTDLLAIGTVALALKVTFESVFEGDQIKKVNALFENLTQNFGLAGDSLKNDLLKAAGGMADTTSILQATNKEMVILGENSAMIPKIMEVARKSTVAFGGDLVERFEGLSMAIATGNARMLRHNGIVIDTKKALQDFAVSIGATTSELNEAGRQQAVFNAVMAFTEKNMKGINTNVENSTTSWVKLKTELKEAGDAIALAINKAFGPAISWMIQTVTSGLHTLSNVLKLEFGDEAEKAATRTDILKGRLSDLNKQIQEMEGSKGKKVSWLESMFGTKEYNEEYLNQMKAQAKSLQAGVDQITKEEQAKAKESESKKTDAAREGGNARFVDQKKVAADRLKLEEEIVKIQEQDAAMEIKTSRSVSELKLAQLHREEAENKRIALEKKKITQQLANGEIADRKLAQKKMDQLDKQQALKKRQYNKEAEREYKEMLQNELDASTNMAEGMRAAWEKNAHEANRALHDFGKQGEMVFDSLKKNSTSAFEAMGKAAIDHSQSASEIMKGFFLNSMADIAQWYGMFYVTEGIASMNPVEIAGGAALLALSGAMRAVAGSSGGGSSSSAGVGGGGGGGSASSATNPTQAPTPASPQGNLTVNLNGDYLNTDQTQRTLLQAIRDATDSTGFAYAPIGQTGS